MFTTQTQRQDLETAMLQLQSSSNAAYGLYQHTRQKHQVKKLWLKTVAAHTTVALTNPGGGGAAGAEAPPFHTRQGRQ